MAIYSHQNAQQGGRIPNQADVEPAPGEHFRRAISSSSSRQAYMTTALDQKRQDS